MRVNGIKRDMSPLSILVNCIILSVALQGTFSMPGNVAVPTPSIQNITAQLVYVCDIGIRGAYRRDDYTHTPGIGSHKLHTKAEPWNQARKICNDEGGHLAIINSNAERRALVALFDRSGPVIGADHTFEAYLGIHDLYGEGDWVTVFGEPITKTGFVEWSDRWNGQPDNLGNNQHCGAMLKEGTMDDVRCDQAFAFFCEIPEISPL